MSAFALTSARESARSLPHRPVRGPRRAPDGALSRLLLQRKPTCACGGGCPRCQNHAFLQPKLAISMPGDPFELEADQITERVMRMPEPQVQRQTLTITPLVQRQAEDGVGIDAQPIVNDVLSSPGQPLDPATRTFMESRFGHGFSQVRLHTNAKAAESTQVVNALAFTVGRDVVFGAGQYAPGTTIGRRLLAHELAHVVQQQTAPPSVQRQDLGGGAAAPDGTSVSITLNVTPQISWAITALMIRPIREEDTWVCLGGVPEYDKPRILLNYLIGFEGNSAFAQIDAQRPPGLDRDTYLLGVAEYIWSLVRNNFMAMIHDRMRRNPSFRSKVERAAAGEGCARAPFLESGEMVTV